MQPSEIAKFLQEGLALHRAGRLDEAKLIYERILQLQSNHFDALQFLALAYRQQKNSQTAVLYFDKALQVNQTNAVVFNNRGNALKDLKQLDEALKSYEEAIRLKPDYAEAYNNRGNALQDLKRLDEALKSYDEAIPLKPDYAQAYSNRGVTLQNLKRLDEALKSYDEAIRFKPDYAEAYYNRANALLYLKQLDEALTSYDEAIHLKPDYAEAYYNRGVTLQDLKRLSEALNSYDEAIRFKPDYADAYRNRGVVCQDFKQPNEALKSYDEAIRLKPDYAEAYYNRGVTLQDLKRLDEALKGYDEAIRLKPDYADPVWNKSLLMLLMGNYREGWLLYESRLDQDNLKANYYTFPQLSWRGQENLTNQTLLIYGEQGLGDIVQFVRYIKEVHALGIKIVLEIPKTLISFISTLNVAMTIVEKGQTLPHFDAYCPLLSLPYVFKTSVETIPGSISYLFSDKQKVDEWKVRLGKQTKKRIGLVWSGSARHKNDQNRSIPMDTFTELLKLPVEWHSLQKEYRDSDQDFLRSHSNMFQHQNNLLDFSDTAALIECMDLVLTVDTSVAHVAGSMGKPVWILLPFMPDFRWMLDREDCPWYPSARLFRQDASRDWSSVLSHMAKELNNQFLIFKN
jgi:tetratricopeptide (TPR) repeat protein